MAGVCETEIKSQILVKKWIWLAKQLLAFLKSAVHNVVGYLHLHVSKFLTATTSSNTKIDMW
jgi:hypothetical protein